MRLEEYKVVIVHSYEDCLNGMEFDNLEKARKPNDLKLNNKTHKYIQFDNIATAKDAIWRDNESLIDGYLKFEKTYLDVTFKFVKK